LQGPVAIVGYMGCGKTTLGRILARTLGWEFVDLDRDIEWAEGRSISEIFADSGEEYFRDLEHRVLLTLLESDARNRIISCGGGIVVRTENRLLLNNIATVFVEESIGVLYERTRGTDRPLRGAGSEEFERRYRERLPLYREVADLTVQVQGRSPRRVASEILRRLRDPKTRVQRRGRTGRWGRSSLVSDRIEVPVAPPYQVVIGTELDLPGILYGELEPALGAILTDSNVGPLHAASLKRALEEVGWRVADVIEIPAGESSKSLPVYAEVAGRLARSGMTRDGTLFALGGGVVGDLAGFVAATFMRGIGFVVLPTSLLAMVDSSVGGKVGLDLPEGKNLLGSFFQPRVVVADLTWLETLPARELSCGLAEVIKMGLLSGGGFFADLDRVQAARAADVDALRTLILHSIAFKAQIVAKDELEKGGRAILNYGHTIGHALEAAAEYLLPHGEAVCAGMVAAAHLSRQELGTNLVGLHEDLLRSAGLPLKVPDVEVKKVLSAMGHDKKRRDGDEYSFVLLEDVGRPLWGVPVSEEGVRKAIGAVVD
jgi:3-dehydroquinate synthase